MIHVLDPHIANQIAAGEVVQRPASVVKELMENAIDSGSSYIELHLTDSGRTLIQVSDRGCGMTPDDALMAFKPHATSKISSIKDLQTLNSLGFRGEALASIAAVAHVQVKTRTADQPVGTLIQIAGSEIILQEECACSPGSVFSVRNLFYNVPARRKFLKSDTTEFRQILAEFQRIALCRLQEEFVFIHNRRTLFHLVPADGFKPRIVQLMGRDFNRELVEIKVNTSVVDIYGYVGNPEFARKTSGYQFFFVNNRFFKSGFLHKAVMNAYERLVAPGKMPSYFICFRVDPASIDVNIHPCKTEVKFEDESTLFQILQSAVREVLGRNAFAPSIDFDREGAPEIVPLKKGLFVGPPKINCDPLFNPFDSDTCGQKEYAPADSCGPLPLKEEPGDFMRETDLPEPGFLVKGKYYITKWGPDVVAVHLKRAQEKLWYDYYRQTLCEAEVPSQMLLSPVSMNIPAMQALLLAENSETLVSMGFAFEYREDASELRITGIPSDHPADEYNVKTSLFELLDALAQNAAEVKNDSRHFLFLTLAHRKTKRKEPFTLVEAQTLWRQLLADPQSRRSPEGKICFAVIDNLYLEQILSD